MYEFLEKLVRVSLPRIRDFKGIESKFNHIRILKERKYNYENNHEK